MADHPPGDGPTVGRRFEAVIFDWDGTAVPDRAADAAQVRSLIERLCALGMDVAVVSGTHVGNIDEQLAARPRGPGTLHLLLNRGSEVFAVGAEGVELIDRRVASPGEDAALDAAAASTVERLAERGLEAEIVSQRLNRRKIDLIPLPEWQDPPKARIGELVVAVEARLRARGLDGIGTAVDLAQQAAAQAGLADARVSSDAKHVEIGLTDKSDSARWILRDLWRRGIGAGLVLLVGDEMGPLGDVAGSDAKLLVPEAARATAISVGVEPGGVPSGVVALGGGPQAFRDLLGDQLARRLAGEVPELDGDPGWTYSVEGVDPELERVHESLLAVADGRIGTRGSPLADHPSANPLVIAAGVYGREGAETELLPGPLWNRLPGADSGHQLRRALDLRTGVMRQELETRQGAVRAILFSSIARPGTAALRVGGPRAIVHAGRPLSAPETAGGMPAEEGAEGDRHWMRVGDDAGGLTAAAIESVAGDGASSIDRVAVYRTAGSAAVARKDALEAIEATRTAGFERLLVEHRAAWGERWDDAEVTIEGDPALQRAVRLALFHLMASVADEGEAPVGARGLTGSAYRGHVFWDSEVFVLPFLAATHPAAARAMLEYRARRLPAAIAAARAAGRAGARLPWESAATGEDVTPTSARDRAGRWVGIHTGALEEHIVADVAWAVSLYLDWTGDDAVAAGIGARLLVETARYWASRIETDADRRGHIRGVIGPDEYHVGIDDNAFTNVMARRNLRRAADLARQHAPDVTDQELRGWLTAADGLVDGYDPDTGLYEQFAGFHELEPLIIADLAPRRPIAADLLLGPDRVSGAQVLKQADVLMLHHLVPDETAPGSLAANLRFYEPRTAHASSLSPGIHAALFARAGRLDDAVNALKLTARIDLDDLSETTAGGVHLAAMGSVWQALAFGFLGIRAADGVLRLDPHLPTGWDALSLRLRFHGARVQLRVESDEVQISTDRRMLLLLGEEGDPSAIDVGTTRLPHRSGGQRETPR